MPGSSEGVLGVLGVPGEPGEGVSPARAYSPFYNVRCSGRASWVGQVGQVGSGLGWPDPYPGFVSEISHFALSQEITVKFM